MIGSFVPHPPSAPWGRPRSPPESMLAIFAVTKGTLCAFMAEHRQHTRLWLPVWSLGLLGEVQQARLLHDVGEPHELGLLGTENFADQDKAQ